MDRLWTPWRYNYVTRADAPGRKGVPAALSEWPGQDRHCVFCNMLGAVAWARDNGFSDADAERAAYIITMREHCFVCLNAFPYSTGHLLILPYEHIASLAGVDVAAAQEMMSLAREAEMWLRSVYHPDGINLGINMGEAAGAGVAGHLHLHALPRWTGDASFMTTVGETRILPEALEETWRRLRECITSEQPKNQA